MPKLFSRGAKVLSAYQSTNRIIEVRLHFRTPAFYSPPLHALHEVWLTVFNGREAACAFKVCSQTNGIVLVYCGKRSQ